jgi:hypothetical protein
MELTVYRTTKTANSTVGDFYINSVKTYFCLEPTDRGLTSQTNTQKAASVKIQNKTAIPTGRYRVTRCFSQKHNANVPLVNNVPGFVGIEIHVGNFPKDTDGCLLLGTSKGPDKVLNSRIAIASFYKLFFAAIDAGENVFITYKG